MMTVNTAGLKKMKRNSDFYKIFLKASKLTITLGRAI